MISRYISTGNIIIFESTVYPGATEDYCVPLIEKYSKLKFNRDFFVGYCPERINPGDKKNNIENINKLVSGSNSKTTNKSKNYTKHLLELKFINIIHKSCGSCKNFRKYSKRHKYCIYERNFNNF